VAELVATQVFAPDAGGRVGIELEWVAVPADGAATPTPDEMRATLPEPLPGASRVTFEPGGQLELSGPAARDLPTALAAMALDVSTAHDAAGRLGCTLVGTGLDSSGIRARVLDAPRYRAMEEYFDVHWPSGRTMMRNTASIQVNVDNGHDGDIAARWRRAHDLGPMLVAAFANSPFDAAGRITGWCSTRFAVWDGIDPSRTGSAHLDGVDPTTAFTRYALDARVMMCWPDGTDGDAVVPRTGLTFGDWIDHGNEFGHPTTDDLVYHLTTLFPPVRPRGWLELRMIDGLPVEWWPVPVALSTALLDDSAAAAAVERALARTRGQWTVAARCGLTDSVLREVTADCFDAASRALPRLGVDDHTIAALDEYRRRYVDRGRSPAHDRIEARAGRHAAQLA
jgi:glutamate--cysteine ligase